MSTAYFAQQNASNPDSIPQFPPWTVTIDAKSMIRCYNGYVPGWTPLENSIANMQQLGIYLKCIRVGTGWNERNKAFSFYVPQQYDATSGTSKDDQAASLGVEVSIYSSDRALFLPNATLPSWLPDACLLTPGNLTISSQQCDYERLFSEPPPSLVANRTRNVNTIEYWIGDGTNSAWVCSLMQNSQSANLLICRFYR